MEYEVFPESDEVSSVNLYSCFSFKWPEKVEGQKNVSMIIEYDSSDIHSKPVHCKAWVQVGKIPFRGLVDEYDVPHQWEEEELIRSIMAQRGSDVAFFTRLSHTVKAVVAHGQSADGKN